MPDAVGTKEKSLLHRSCQEGSVAEDVEDVFGCRNEERFSLYDVDAVDVRFALRVLCRKKLRDSDEKKEKKRPTEVDRFQENIELKHYWRIGHLADITTFLDRADTTRIHDGSCYHLYHIHCWNTIYDLFHSVIVLYGGLLN